MGKGLVYVSNECMINLKYDEFYTGKLTRQNMQSVLLLVACVVRSELQGLQVWWCLLSGWSNRLNLFASQIPLTRQCHFGSSVSRNEQNIAQRTCWLARRNRCGVFARIWPTSPSLSVQWERYAWIKFLACNWYSCNFPYSALQLHDIVLLASLAFRHLVEFIKPADVTDIHPVNFLTARTWRQFGSEINANIWTKKGSFWTFPPATNFETLFLTI